MKAAISGTHLTLVPETPKEADAIDAWVRGTSGKRHATVVQEPIERLEPSQKPEGHDERIEKMAKARESAAAKAGTKARRTSGMNATTVTLQ